MQRMAERSGSKSRIESAVLLSRCAAALSVWILLIGRGGSAIIMTIRIEDLTQLTAKTGDDKRGWAEEDIEMEMERKRAN